MEEYEREQHRPLGEPLADAAPARLFLNLKGIPYKTEWIEYPDIAPTFKSLGIPPNDEGVPYTIPTIRIGDKYIMDSKKIAAELEKQFPSPPLYIDSPLVGTVQKHVSENLGALRGVLMPKGPRFILNDASVPYWNETRSKRFGMPLDQFEKEFGGEDAWENVKPPMKELGALLKAEGGPFLMGKTGKTSSLCVSCLAAAQNCCLTHLCSLVWRSGACRCFTVLEKLPSRFL